MDDLSFTLSTSPSCERARAAAAAYSPLLINRRTSRAYASRKIWPTVSWFDRNALSRESSISHASRWPMARCIRTRLSRAAHSCMAGFVPIAFSINEEARPKRPVRTAAWASLTSIEAAEMTLPVRRTEERAADKCRLNCSTLRSINATHDALTAKSSANQALGLSCTNPRAKRRCRSASTVRPRCASMVATESCRYAIA